MLENKRSYTVFYNICDISGLSPGLGLVASGLGLDLGLTLLWLASLTTLQDMRTLTDTRL